MFPFASARSLAALAVLFPLAAASYADRLSPWTQAQLEYVSASPGYLGVDLRDVDATRAKQLHLQNAQGVEITALDHDAPACKAGLHTGDVITAIDGETVVSADQVRRRMRELPAGKHVRIAVSRSGKPLEIKVQLANREVLAQEAWKKHFHVSESAPMVEGFAGQRGFLSPGIVMPPSNSTEHIGASVRPMSPQLAAYFGAKDGGGLLVESVEAESPAAAAGLQAGDVILKVNGTAVMSPVDLIGAVRSSRGRPVQLTVLRDHHEQNISVAVQATKTESRLGPEVDQGRALAEVQPSLEALRDPELGKELEQAENLDRATIDRALAQAREQIRNIDMAAVQAQVEDAMKQITSVNMPVLEKQLDAARQQMEELIRRGPDEGPAGSYSF